MDPGSLPQGEISALEAGTSPALSAALFEIDRQLLSFDKNSKMTESSADTRLNPGDTVQVGIEAARLHLFDLETGLVIRG
jgi:hypothetical protein